MVTEIECKECPVTDLFAVVRAPSGPSPTRTNAVQKTDGPSHAQNRDFAEEVASEAPRPKEPDATPGRDDPPSGARESASTGRRNGDLGEEPHEPVPAVSEIPSADSLGVADTGLVAKAPRDAPRVAATDTSAAPGRAAAQTASALTDGQQPAPATGAPAVGPRTPLSNPGTGTKVARAADGRAAPGASPGRAPVLAPDPAGTTIAARPVAGGAEEPPTTARVEAEPASSRRDIIAVPTAFAGRSPAAHKPADGRQTPAGSPPPAVEAALRQKATPGIPFSAPPQQPADVTSVTPVAGTRGPGAGTLAPGTGKSGALSTEPGSDGRALGLGTIGADSGVSPQSDGSRAPETQRVEVARTEQPSRWEGMRGIGSQLVEAIRQGRDGTIEVSLVPEELGRLKLSLLGNEMSLHVVVQADRSDTQELIRRHIGHLQQEFLALGYRDVSFAFGQQGGQDHGQDFAETSAPPSAPGDTGPETPVATRASRTPATGQLDLRL